MPLHFMDGGGLMGEAIRAFDWASTSLGPAINWPPTLKTAVALVIDSRFPKCIVWGPDLITIYNDAFRPILGAKPEALGRPFNEVWAEAWDELEPMVRNAYAGKSTFLEDWRIVINRHGWPEEAWFTFGYSPLRDEFGRVVGMMDTVMETTGKVLAERESRLLNGELAHRIKNILTVVQAIASQTFNGAEDMDGAQRVFAARLVALADAHDILTRSSRGATSVEEVVMTALKPHLDSPDRVTIEGRRTLLDGRQALSLGLAMHELATNAAKYGALSEDGGRVEIRWEAGDPGSEEPFVLLWIERGGPSVALPTRQGFGSRLITRVLASDVKGSAVLRYPPEGVEFELNCRMVDLADLRPDVSIGVPTGGAGDAEAPKESV